MGGADAGRSRRRGYADTVIECIVTTMKTKLRFGSFFCLALLAAVPSLAQTLYKSVGPDGRVVYSDQPPADGKVQKTMTFENLPSTTLPAATAAYLEQQLKKLRTSSYTPSAPATSGVVLYSADWCGYCKKAKAYLGEKGIGYREVNIDTPDGMTAFAQEGGGKGVPLLVADGQRVRGFSPPAYDALFARKK